MELNLAFTQTLHLHLNKWSSPVCLSGFLWLPLSFLFSRISPAPRPHSGRRFSGRLFIFSTLFSCIACRMCVNLCPPLGEWNNEVDLFRSTAPSFGDDTVRCWRHLVHLKGMWKTTFPSSFCPPLLCRENICSSATHSLLNVQPNS